MVIVTKIVLDMVDKSKGSRYFQEHHLQRAISAQQVYGDTQQLVIPTPETKPVDIHTSLIDDPENDFKIPKQYIHVQGWIILLFKISYY